VGRGPWAVGRARFYGRLTFFVARTQNFGLTFRLVQLGVVSRPSRLEGFAFKDDGDDDMPAAGGAMDTSDAADDAVPAEEEF